MNQKKGKKKVLVGWAAKDWYLLWSPSILGGYFPTMGQIIKSRTSDTYKEFYPKKVRITIEELPCKT